MLGWPIWLQGTTQNALADLASRCVGGCRTTYDFLAPASLAAAQRSALIILEAADQIAENPGIGTPRAEFREWPAKFGRSAYILRYHILQSGDVLMTRVWHSREQRGD